MGGGTSGSVLADRLTEFREESQVRVLVLEAGTDGTHIDLEVPMDGIKQWHTDDHDWQYKTVRQEKACHSSKDKVSLVVIERNLLQQGRWNGRGREHLLLPLVSNRSLLPRPSFHEKPLDF